MRAWIWAGTVFCRCSTRNGSAWKRRLATRGKNSENLQWRRVASEADLIGWEREWATADPDVEKSRLFVPGLLSEPDILFVSLLVNGAAGGGGILNRGAGIVGLSNVFATSIDIEAAWRGLVRAAGASFPGQALVAYDREKELAAAHRAGFATIGLLRIWRRPPATPS